MDLTTAQALAGLLTLPPYEALLELLRVLAEAVPAARRLAILVPVRSEVWEAGWVCPPGPGLQVSSRPLIGRTETLWFPDAVSEQRVFSDDEALGLVPLEKHGQALGWLYIGAGAPGALNHEALRLLQAVAPLAAGILAPSEIRAPQPVPSVAETLQLLYTCIVDEALPHQSCVIYLWDQGRFIPAFVHSPLAELVETAPQLMLWEEGLERSLFHAEAVVDEVTNPFDPTRIFRGESSGLYMPLVADKVLGAVYLGSVSQGAYTEFHLRRLRALADRFAAYIDFKTRFERAEEGMAEIRLQLQVSQDTISQVLAAKEREVGEATRRLEELRHWERFSAILERLSTRTAAAVNPDEALLAVGEAMGELLPGAQDLAILLVDEGRLREAWSRWGDTYQFNRVRLLEDHGGGWLGKAMESGQPLVFKRIHGARRQPQFYLVAPLGRRPVLGCLVATASSFTSSEKRLWELLARQSEFSLDWHSGDEADPFRDPVTGLRTHTWLQLRLGELERGCLALLELDRFQSFNHAHGHLQGDRMLREIGRVLVGAFPGEDPSLVCRFSGDQFAVLFPGADKGQAKAICARLLQAVDTAWGDGYTGPWQVPINASVGLACMPTDARRPADLLSAARSALAASKRLGGNQLCLAPSLPAREEDSDDGRGGWPAHLKPAPKGPMSWRETRELD